MSIYFAAAVLVACVCALVAFRTKPETKNTTVTMSSRRLGFFLGARAGLLPEIPQVVGRPSPAIATDVDSWMQQLAGTPQESIAQHILRNTVKKCTACEKPNAITLVTCNNCGASIAETPTSYTTNVFTAFILGLAKGPFPLSISIRGQTKDVLILDDLLALSPLHFNAIPTSHYIPDWRYLLTRPAEGLALVQLLVGELHRAAETHFLSRPEWCSAAIKGGTLPREAMMMGFNYPPSQYQLHIQYIAPNLVPFQRYQYLKGRHYTYGRFFPVAYAVACLEALIAHHVTVPTPLLGSDVPVQKLTQFFFDTYGVDYDAMHRAAYDTAGANYERYAIWREDQFERYVEEDATGTLPALPDGADLAGAVNKDKTTLQNYGRPYTSEGKPTGSYYAFPKAIDELTIWSA
jgi:hypothetical protein